VREEAERGPALKLDNFTYLKTTSANNFTYSVLVIEARHPE
jgi:hypothetical protein